MATESQESADLLYAMRAVMVLMGSGIGLEAAIQMIGRGGYGVITKDFKNVVENLQKGSRLEDELTRLSTKASSKGYRRFLSTLRSNVSSDTDLVRALQQQSEREEEERNEKLKGYIESLSGLPTILLTLGMLSPIIFGIVAMVPIIAPELMSSPIPGMSQVAAMASCFGPALFFTIAVMCMMGYKAHSKDPGVI
ncbi:MAG: type II secretion system F family protein [Candidatus Thalassarchaeaceae archaeon]|jgi:pilus assembly protein TadC|nr:type II secretion system F family protein [Candidatus Thalassarchaeaceae archaeon]